MKNIDFNIKTVIKSAKNIGIPVINLWDSGFYQIGYGYKGKLIKDNLNFNSNVILLDILKDRFVTSQILKTYNIPVIYRKKISNINELKKISDKLKYPLVIKPQFISKKSVVACNIKNQKELIKFYEIISKKHKNIILEEYLEGKKYQVCVVKNEVIAVTLRDKDNCGDNKYIYKDFTNIISEENKNICISIAKILGLDICNIDIVSLDICCSLKKQGAVIEVSNNPEIKIHDFLCSDRSLKITDSIVNHLSTIVGYIPIVFFIGNENKGIIAKLANYILSKMGYKVGLKLQNEIIITNEVVYEGLDEFKLNYKNILTNKNVELGIIEVDEKLNFDIDMQYNSLGIGVINKYKNELKDIILNTIKNNKTIIINADDFNKIDALLNEVENKIFFSLNSKNKILQENISKGNIAVYLDENIIYVENNNKKYKIINTTDINIYTKNEEGKLNDIIAMIAALVYLRVDYCIISKGIIEFFNK